ncbi:MAG: nuclear transport factor 2 family protein [Halioglobus sp.]|nr:nuclear transport factor 2 family protein [Halioglobus sp.]
MELRVALFTLMLAASTPSVAGDSADITLDNLHQAGAAADPATFLAQMTADAVLLGMGGTGQLEGPSLQQYVNERFARGDAWDVRSVYRVVQHAVDGNTAWFTEHLEDTAGGRSWATGVLIRTSGHWQIAQYATAPIRATEPTSGIPAGTATAGAEHSGHNNVATPVAAEAVRPKPDKKVSCQRFRHKTNRVASC